MLVAYTRVSFVIFFGKLKVPIQKCIQDIFLSCVWCVFESFKNNFKIECYKYFFVILRENEYALLFCWLNKQDYNHWATEHACTEMGPVSIAPMDDII